MEQYKEKLRITNVFLMIGCIVLAVFAVLAIGSELGWFHILKPVAGDSHWASSWNGFITGASCGVLGLLLYSLIRNRQALKDEKTLTECVLNSKNSMCKGPGVRLHLSMGLNVRPLCH